MADNDRTEEQLRELERQFWNAFMKGDTSFADKVHERFHGWPHGEEVKDREGLIKHSKKYEGSTNKPIITKFELTTSGTVAVVHLLRNGSRIMHTWVREADGWRLIGGMSFHPVNTSSQQ